MHNGITQRLVALLQFCSRSKGFVKVRIVCALEGAALNTNYVPRYSFLRKDTGCNSHLSAREDIRYGPCGDEIEMPSISDMIIDIL